MTEETEINWQKDRQIVLTYLHSKYDSMSEFMRARPFIVFQDSVSLETILVSPNDAINEVNFLSDLGKKIITAELVKMGRLQ